MALGVTLVFAVTQLFAWPLCHIAPVFAAMLLQDAGPVSIRKGSAILSTAFFAIGGGYVIASLLSPYPALLVLTFGVLLFRLYLFLVTAGAHLLAAIAVVLGAVVMPVLVVMQPDIAFIIGVAALLNFVVAILAAWVAFLLLPAPPALPSHAVESLSAAKAISMARSMMLVIGPLFIAFLLFGWSDILVLVYSAVITTALSAEGGSKQGGNLFIANLVLGGLAMLIVYEALVMVPSLAFMIAMVLCVCLIFGRGIFAGGHWAALWSSGLNGFLILLGGTLLKEDVDAGSKMFDRVFQILLATAYVAFAYQVLELFRALKLKWRPGGQSHRV